MRSLSRGADDLSLICPRREFPELGTLSGGNGIQVVLPGRLLGGVSRFDAGFLQVVGVCETIRTETMPEGGRPIPRSRLFSGFSKVIPVGLAARLSLGAPGRERGGRSVCDGT